MCEKGIHNVRDILDDHGKILNWQSPRFNPKQAGEGGRGGIRPWACSSLCCAETANSRKLKLCDFYYILITFYFEYKPVLWNIHCCHGNAVVEKCLV